MSWRLAKGEAHFVGGLEAEGFVEGAAGGAGVERDTVEAFGTAPVEHGLQKLFCQAEAAGFGFGVHVEDPGALCERFTGVAGPSCNDDSAAGNDARFGSFREPGFVSAEAQGFGEIFPGRLIDLVKHGGIAMSHIFEHGAAVTDEMGQIVEVGAANVKLRHFLCCRAMTVKGRDNMVWRDWRLEGRRRAC